MRSAALLLVALCACESRYGVYLTVDGDANEIRFDHVRLYFGKNGQTASIGRPSGATMGEVFEHDANPSDEFDVEMNADGSLATEAVYYLPIADENAKLDYVAAVAFDSTTARDMPVGVGELFGFSFEDGIVNKYDIELQKPGLEVEMWGTSQDCFSWTKQRDGQFSTVAVLSPDDLDCDGITSMADCNDLCPLGSQTCDPNAGVCGGPQVCGLGCAHNGLCAIQTCLPDLACGTECAGKGPSLDARLNCVSANPAPHVTVDVAMNNGKPCTRVFDVPLPSGRTCTGVQKIWQQNFFDGWILQVAPSVDDPLHCIVAIENTNAAASFSGDHHVLAAFPPIAPAMSQWTLFLGVRPGVSDPLCGGEGYVVESLPGTPNDCL